MNVRSPGHHFLQIPGPTNVPGRVLRAISEPTIDHRGPGFADLSRSVLSGLKRVFKTNGPVVVFPASGTYDIHTSRNACAAAEVLTPWGESGLGGGYGAGAWPVWRCAPGKRGEFLHARLVACGGKGASVRKLGGDRAGEMRISRFLHNRRVTASEIVETAAARTFARVSGRHVLAIQDTTSVRVDERGFGLSAHPLIAVDAISGFTLGLVDLIYLDRRGAERAPHKERSFEDKESRRWLDGAQSAARLREAGAACVTVVEDREGDIYECFAFKPAGIEKVVRASQDRLLADGSRLFAAVAAFPEAGRMTIELAAVAGRKARQAVFSLRFGQVAISRPKNGKGRERLPETLVVNLVEAREINPPKGEAPAHWRLLTTHDVNDVADARRIVGFYRLRWTIEQLFRTTKTKGFDIESLRQQEGGPLEKLVAATIVAAVTVMQLVAERDGKLRRPLSDAFDPDDRPVLERVGLSLEGKTAKQKNPHPKGSLAFASWVFARLGGWTGYYGKPGPIVILRGLTEFHAIKHGWSLRDV